MNFVQYIFMAVAVSGPIAIFIGVALAALCFVRSCRSKNVKFAVVSGIGALSLLVLLAAIIVVWFGYGVAHTGKDATTDLVVLAITVGPAYLSAFAAWRFSIYLKKRLSHDAL